MIDAKLGGRRMINVCFQCGAYRADKNRRSAVIAEQKRFNQWFKDHGASKPAVTLLDTTDAEANETVEQVRRWIERRLDAADVPAAQSER